MEAELIRRGLQAGQTMLNLAEDEIMAYYKIMAKLDFRIREEEKKNANKLRDPGRVTEDQT